MQLWPAIDIRNGKCVRLVQGDYSRQRVYGDSPVEMARHWIGLGAECLHIVDLDAARTPDGEQVREHNRETIARLTGAVSVPCQIGGGLRDRETIDFYRQAGAARLVCGTRAILDFEWFSSLAEEFPGVLVAGIDARDGQVAVAGWESGSAMGSLELARRMSELPLAAIVHTDIARDGMLQGPNMEMMQAMAAAVRTPVVASGGVTSLADIRGLASLGMAGAIIGRALYEGNLELPAALEAASGCGTKSNCGEFSG